MKYPSQSRTYTSKDEAFKTIIRQSILDFAYNFDTNNTLYDLTTEQLEWRLDDTVNQIYDAYKARNKRKVHYKEANQ